jgi:hypothetical protein
MNLRRNICAVVPVKETTDAKQRLAGVLPGAQRQQLALTMLEDVLAALASVHELAGMLVVTIDPMASAIAARYGARVSANGAREGHTGAVAAAARLLAATLTCWGCRATFRWPKQTISPNHRGHNRSGVHHRAGTGQRSSRRRSARGRRGPLRFRENGFFPLGRSAGAGSARDLGAAAHRARYRYARGLALFLATPSCARAGMLDQWRVDRDDRIRSDGMSDHGALLKRDRRGRVLPEPQG